MRFIAKGHATYAKEPSHATTKRRMGASRLERGSWHRDSNGAFGRYERGSWPYYEEHPYYYSNNVCYYIETK